jgi:glycosyltransferase involved in cell wall biosynthesis
MTSLAERPKVAVSAQEVSSAATPTRIRADGKFFSAGSHRWLLKGLTYGPFAPNTAGEPFPDMRQLHNDFAQIRELGSNAIRVYHEPSLAFVDAALEHDLRVFIDIPWEKHRCFFEDWSAQETARRTARETARRLGKHPGVFALSVVNEIPNDVVRFYGHRRVERFIEELVDTVKQEAPDCLTTFANFPTNEFLRPRHLDFHCFNVYLDDGMALGRYLDRLQHVAGNLPLILGEFGVDSIRHGADVQARRLGAHVRQVFERGLAGSFVFAYTDEWHTGGNPITDWDFGITDRERRLKPAAKAVSGEWAKVPNVRQMVQPKVSIVVCSYNGATTLEECLHSLTELNYPDYEVILIDDGSKDNTAEIAANFPSVKYVHQVNKGLSAARNAGARLASGEIVAYTDSDCMADPEWLTYLVSAMQRQNVHAIGGPNIPPATDSATAKCVAASPGGPSHVMIDDRTAEHIPGCNMAFYRDQLLECGGFDHQFRQAGDDVDICWRYLDRGWKIGFAPGAVVWHKRRNTVGAYLRQQKGYGRAEAMLRLKHPHRFTNMGTARWHGIIYGEGAVGLPVVQPVIYHGRFGSSLFQSVYAANALSLWTYPGLLEWQVLAAFLIALSVMFWPLAVIGILMLVASATSAIRMGNHAPLPINAPRWSRPLVYALTYVQPLIRGWHRSRYWFAARNTVHTRVRDLPPVKARRGPAGAQDLSWESTKYIGREALLKHVEEECQIRNWPADVHVCVRNWDLELIGDAWHTLRVHTATEELGWPKRFTRCRIVPVSCPMTRVVVAGLALMAAIALLSGSNIAMGVSLVVACFLLLGLLRSHRRCLDMTTRLLAHCAKKAELVPWQENSATQPIK